VTEFWGLSERLQKFVSYRLVDGPLCIMTWWCFCDMLVRYIIVGCLWLITGWLNFMDYLRKIAKICGL